MRGCTSRGPFYAPGLPPPTVRGDMPCAGCGYNLRTLRTDRGRCPECGAAVALTAGRRRGRPLLDPTRWPTALREPTIWRRAAYALSAIAVTGIAAVVYVDLNRTPVSRPSPGAAYTRASASRTPAPVSPVSATPPPGRAPTPLTARPSVPSLLPAWLGPGDPAAEPPAPRRDDRSDYGSGERLVKAIREASADERRVLDRLRSNAEPRPGP